MTLSLPSREIICVDVPEVNNFSACFRYNFFVNDESVNAISTIPIKELNGGGSIDDESVKIVLARVPRLVELTFSNVMLERDDASSTNPVIIKPGTLLNNLDKIITEDQISSNSFISVNFHDGEADNKIDRLISGSLVSSGLSFRGVANGRATRAFGRGIVDDGIDVRFMATYINSDDNIGLSYYSDRDGVGRPRGTSQDILSVPPASSGRGNKMQLQRDGRRKLKKVHSNVQVNAKVLHEIVRAQVNDASSHLTNDMQAMWDQSLRLESSARKQNILPSDDDYKSILPYIDLKVKNSTKIPDRSSLDVVGYIIDRCEIRGSKLIDLDPIVLEGQRSMKAFDVNVRYGTTYRYQIRSIVRFKLPAVDADTGSFATITSLISSRPSAPVYVSCIETQAPPPPNDPNFHWNYENNSMTFSWTMPVNVQRDIKQFQVFRRSSFNEPFELMKVFNFDDSLVLADQVEFPDVDAIENVESPVMSWIDGSFTKDSKFIYSVVSIDAHGMSSNYSAQFQINFDLFKNCLIKKLISHSGAPKSYPNLYLERDLFVDNVRSSGKSKMKIVFNPEYYDVVDDSNKLTHIVQTRQRHADYRFQVMNIDNHGSDVVIVTIDDRRVDEKLNVAKNSIKK